MNRLRAWVLALAMAATASGAAQAQISRPSPTLFRGAGCEDAACVRGRWLAFLKDHGETELAGSPLIQVRLITFNAEACDEALKDRIDIRRYEFKPGEAGRQDEVRCGARKSKSLPAERVASITRLLADPEASKLEGAFPAYCGESEGGAAFEINFLEMLEGQRYRLIEWDCETPRVLKPLAAWLDEDRSRLP